MTTLSLPYSIAQMVKDRADELGDTPVFYFNSEPVTYRDLHRNSNKTANRLAASGIKKGDRVAFLGKNSPSYFELIAAAAKIGAVIVPINWRLAGPELKYILNDCQAKKVFLELDFLPNLEAIKGDLTLNPETVLLTGNAPTTTSYEDWRTPFPDQDPGVTVTADDEVVQLYTSGTTGRPKGALLTSTMLLSLRGQASSDVVEDWQRYEQGETGLLVMPCFHVGGTSFGLGIIFNGANSVILPEYDQDQIIQLIEQFKVSKVFMVPAALKSLLDNPSLQSADVRSLRHIYYGASPIPLELMKAAIKRFGCAFVQMYGMTESGGTIVALTPEDHDLNGGEKMGSVGKALVGVELKIIDRAGHTLPAGEVGEIATRSSKNIKAYWNLPEATQSTIDDEGWLRTGDAGYLDSDGYLYIRDRVKDMIISGGENIYPAEVENALLSHPQVGDCLLYTSPSPRD